MKKIIIVVVVVVILYLVFMKKPAQAEAPKSTGTSVGKVPAGSTYVPQNTVPSYGLSNLVDYGVKGDKVIVINAGNTPVPSTTIQNFIKPSPIPGE